ncbi:pistil-specific extensin-like protein [Ischnura elegans]|uniref:pistil-specific extensin-like protein n=1 Tax=Ischnura elegans TaxID=197161 RepID=UPI001ED8AF76|nr:pistil-specific extensin-like protein [Ischnura elegans]
MGAVCVCDCERVHVVDDMDTHPLKGKGADLRVGCSVLASAVAAAAVRGNTTPHFPTPPPLRSPTSSPQQTPLLFPFHTLGEPFVGERAPLRPPPPPPPPTNPSPAAASHPTGTPTHKSLPSPFPTCLGGFLPPFAASNPPTHKPLAQSAPG